MQTRKPPLPNKRYQMMKDFDILAINKKQQKTLYEKANYQKGLEMMNPTYVRDEEGRKYAICVPIQQFQIFGPGIYLLFLFLKYSTILFFILSMISFISLGLLASGGQLSQKENTFQIQITKTTLANIQPHQLPIIVIFDYIKTLVILVAIIYWKQKQLTYVVECCKKIMLPSYQTIILEHIPEGYTQNQMKIFLQERFGEIQDIYTVRDFHNDLYHYKQISDIIMQYKEERALLKIQSQRGSLKLAKLFFEYENQYNSILERDTLYKYPKQFAFITFKSVKSRQEMIRFYSKTFLQLDQTKKQHYQFKGQQLKIKACMMQPDGIKWQNLNIPKKHKIMWGCVQILLLTIVLIISIALTFILYQIQSSLTLTKYQGLSKQQIKKLDSQQALQSYCLGLSIIKFNSDPDCEPFSSSYTQYMIYLLALPLSLSLFKFLLTQIMKFLVNLRRHPYYITQIQSEIVIMLVFYFFASGVLQYIAFLQINFNDGSKFSLFQIMTPIHNLFFNHFYKNAFIIQRAHDYDKNWYIVTSEKIFLIAIASFNMSSLGKIVYVVMKKVLCEFYAKRQILQSRMNHWLRGQQIQIQFVYAVAITIILFILLFGASMPLLYPFTFISLFILYWSTKFIFLKFCTKPLLYSHCMNSLIVNILLCGVIMHSIVSPIYFGAPTIHSEKGVGYFIRLPYYGYYIVFIVVSLVYMIYRDKLLHLVEKVKNYYYESNNLKGDQKQVTHHNKKLKRMMSLPSKLCLIQDRLIIKKHKSTMSYSMHENQDYEMILKTLYTINREQRARVSCLLNQDVYDFILKQDTLIDLGSKYNSSGSRLFNELLKLTQENSKKFLKTVGENYYKSNNPYQKYLDELQEIRKMSIKVQSDPTYKVFPFGLKSASLKSFNLNQLKNRDITGSDYQKSKNIQIWKKILQQKQNVREIIIQKSDQQSLSNTTNKNQSIYNQIDLEEDPGTDVRLRSVEKIKSDNYLENFNITQKKNTTNYPTQSTMVSPPPKQNDFQIHFHGVNNNFQSKNKYSQQKQPTFQKRSYITSQYPQRIRSIIIPQYSHKQISQIFQNIHINNKTPRLLSPPDLRNHQSQAQ